MNGFIVPGSVGRAKELGFKDKIDLHCDFGTLQYIPSIGIAEFYGSLISRFFF